MATFVLVPGACCGGWTWKKLAPLLRTAGHDVYTPTLTGLGERLHLTHPGIDRTVHVTDVVNVIAFDDLQDVVLVGWSYGGLVITEVADRVPERVSRLIYLDATVLADGENLYDAWPDGLDWRAGDRAEAAAAGTPEFWPVPVDSIRAQVPEEDDREWLLNKMVAHPLASFVQPARLENRTATRLPRAFVRCTLDRDRDEPEPAFLLHARSDPGWHYRELAANHMAPVTAPRDTAEVLLSLVQVSM